MDTLETYTKMCDCEEIQKLRVIRVYNRIVHKYEPETDMWQGGDWFYADGEIYMYGGDNYSLCIYDGRIDLSSAGYCEGAGSNVNKVIWLPQQDQLQEMVQGKRTAFNLLEWIVEATGWHATNASMEQLWLAFVMKEKYNKTWDGEKWLS